MKKPSITPRPPADDLITRQQVAQRLNVHPATVRRMQIAKKLTPFVFGAHMVRYSSAEVEALVQSAKLAPVA